MLLPELQRLAGELGISGTGRMRKGDLVAAISARPGGAPAGGAGRSTPLNGSASANGSGSLNGGAPATATPLEAPVSGGANGGVLDSSNGSSVNGSAAPNVRTRRAA